MEHARPQGPRVRASPRPDGPTRRGAGPLDARNAIRVLPDAAALDALLLALVCPRHVPRARCNGEYPSVARWRHDRARCPGRLGVRQPAQGRAPTNLKHSPKTTHVRTRGVACCFGLRAFAIHRAVSVRDAEFRASQSPVRFGVDVPTPLGPARPCTRFAAASSRPEGAKSKRLPRSQRCDA